MLKNAFILFIAAFVILVIFLPQFTKVQDMRQKDLDYQIKIAELEAAKKNLEKKRRQLENDPFYLEKAAREKMGLIREGEVVYKLRQVNAVE